MDFSIFGCNPNIIALKDAITLNYVLLVYQTKYRHRVFLYLVAFNFLEMFYRIFLSHASVGGWDRFQGCNKQSGE